VLEATPHEQAGTASAPPRALSVLQRRAHVVLVGALLVGGLLLRLPGIQTPSIEQRETEGALLAREWYLGGGSGLPAWKQRVLHALDSSVRPIEPPLLDYATSLEYRASGENFWFPRLLSSFFWVLGGVFLYLIAVRLMTRSAAVIALALYLTWPYAVWLSRHFMPDALLVCSLLAASLTVIRYWERPGRGRLVAAGAVACFATAVKPGVAIFFLVALFASLAVSRRQLRASVVGGGLPLFTAFAGSAALAYYVYGRYLSHFIWRAADSGRVRPHLLIASDFWQGWWNMVSYLLRYPQPQAALAFVPLAVGLAGLALARGTARAVLVGLTLGYVAFALTFANYTQTHPYYSLPLIPILTLSIGLVASSLLGRLGRAGHGVLAGLVVLAVAVAAFKAHAVLTGKETRQTIADYRSIGRLTGHTTRALIVSGELRTPAMYWGWIVGDAWDVGDYPNGLPRSMNPAKYDFLVVEGVDQIQTTPGLRRLARRLPVVARTSRYAIFDLRGQHAG
jgi:4-amino-4-deoxy-L-arabinose transferase-like glycosyltransferase